MAAIKTEEKPKINEIYGQMEAMEHEQLVICYDKPTGLKAIIAIHNTVLGPSLGGTRMWHYTNEEDAIKDVLRLSRGMTLKASISGLNIGGGKAVLIGDPSMKNEAYLRRFGRFIESLGGRYITAEDMNTQTSDMEYIAMETKHVTGLPESKGGGGDPSPVTAYGTYLGIKAAAKKAYGSDSLEGKKILIQGTGQVGKHLAEYLSKEKAHLMLADINEDRAARVAASVGGKIVSANSIHEIPMDIYAPCAMGGQLNDQTIPALTCDIVAGAANNQLDKEQVHARQLMDHGILYAPDFLINAGGLINVYQEYQGNYSKALAMEKAEKIYDTCLDVFELAGDQGISPHEAALQKAIKRVQDMGKLKMSW
ncbi:Glu/Leu/Phe/Val family dehydrogenase [Cyclobacterium amurskyense]|uniref:Leucine dehydrogenase n=1 Tax=Cyclobacterium amurskyense TaxID=320787 RepID=A0A0H4PAH0_9BACT|nr:Glu/Leu/Phe/Val dehydrogenase [Cyclobacterium amurskyense]AKP51446.1 Leucine dehydrogenase [Cyclobacterium amurskyense]|tara:strand:- start:9350 stop:10450 length:1101 start_codon:yes stop_codon:yes gene_type:complete